jgi:hypothetical protein
VRAISKSNTTSGATRLPSAACSSLKCEKAVVPAGTNPTATTAFTISERSCGAYFTKISGLGGSAMPAPMWNPVCGGWL